MNENNFPNIRAIRAAILSAPSNATGFSLNALHDPATRQQLRNAAHLQQFLTDVRIEAHRAQSTPIEPLPFSLFHLFELTGERTQFEAAYFDRRRRLGGLALATVIDETDQYLVALTDLLWEICNEYTWSLPAHLPVGIDQVKNYRLPPEQVIDLFAPETAHALAEVVSLLGDKLDPWLHYRVVNEIERRLFHPLFNDPRQFEWESAPMNWAAVCGGCIGIAALILEPDRERLVGMMDRVIRTMACFLEGFGNDGGCPEGIDYWVYGFGYFTYFAAALKTFTGGTLDLFNNDRVRKIVAFPQKISLRNGRYINYSDAAERAVIHPGLGSYLAKHFQEVIPDLGVPNFHGDHCYRWGHITRNLLWTEPNLLGQQATNTSTYLDDLGWVIDRRTLNERSVVFSAKGGHNDEPHNHNDLGHFIVHFGGETLLADPGAGVYTRQYFREERYDFLHTGSQGHSVPVINGYRQAFGAAHTAAILTHEAHSNGIKFVLDLTKAYAILDLESFVRSFNWSIDAPRQNTVLQLTDTFSFATSSNTVEECFISFFPPTIQGGSLRWKGTHSLLTMEYDSEQFTTLIEPVDTFTHQSEPITVYRACLRAHNVNNLLKASFVFKLAILQ